MKIKITPTEWHRFRELFKKDNESNLIIKDDMKGVFEEETIWRKRGTFVRSNLHFLIIHDVDKMINFLKTTLKEIDLNPTPFFRSDNRLLYNSIKSIIKKINKENK